MLPESLSVFLEVMQRGSFAAVARARGLDPSTVSRLVAGLEADLGFRLFQRTTRRLAPTEAGELYFRRVQPLAEELARARSEALDLSDRPTGTLRVTCSVSFGQSVLVPLLPAFRARAPGLSLELLVTDAVLDLIEERVDVAIRHVEPQEASLIAAKLAPTRWHVVASPDWVAREGRPARPEDLVGCDCLRFLMRDYRDRWRFRDREGRITEVPIGGSISISAASLQRQAALDGVGPAMLSDRMVGADIAAGRLIDLFPDYDATATEFGHALWVVYPSRRYLPLKVRVFIDFLRARLAQAAGPGMDRGGARG
ncbi:MAG TPA: LysR family transcriptional regulator [Paracoccaceae bacterium]|nr:LysR family transcriptional regulator [Paracoccaceae bacterium]